MPLSCARTALQVLARHGVQRANAKERPDGARESDTDGTPSIRERHLGLGAPAPAMHKLSCGLASRKASTPTFALSRSHLERQQADASSAGRVYAHRLAPYGSCRVSACAQLHRSMNSVTVCILPLSTGVLKRRCATPRSGMLSAPVPASVRGELQLPQCRRGGCPTQCWSP